MRKFLTVILAAVITVCMVTPVFAISDNTQSLPSDQAIEIAKSYFLNYSEVSLNSSGQEVVTSYGDVTAEMLDKIAIYIAQVGVSAFEEEVKAAIEDVVTDESINTTRSAPMRTISKYVKLNEGNNYISGSEPMLVDFGELGTMEYTATLRYTLKVQNGAIVDLNSPGFELSLPAYGSYSNVRLPYTFSDTYANMTANYDVTKTIDVPIIIGSIPIRSATTNQINILQTYNQS